MDLFWFLKSYQNLHYENIFPKSIFKLHRSIISNNVLIFTLITPRTNGRNVIFLSVSLRNLNKWGHYGKQTAVVLLITFLYFFHFLNTVILQVVLPKMVLGQLRPLIFRHWDEHKYISHSNISHNVFHPVCFEQELDKSAQNFASTRSWLHLLQYWQDVILTLMLFCIRGLEMWLNMCFHCFKVFLLSEDQRGPMVFNSSTA